MLRPRLAQLALAAASAALSGCLLLPVRTAPGVEGRVVDAATHRPLEGALVVVRFDARHGTLLPDRELIGHAEVRTDADGRFQVARRLEPGVAVLPFYAGEARVVSVLRDGYRCARPQRAAGDASLEIALAPALDLADRRESCRPVAARRGEAAAYRAAWRTLFDDRSADVAREDQERLEQILGARAALGFGENCEGPALDLALSPPGDRVAVAFRTAKGTSVRVAELGPKPPTSWTVAGDAQRVPPRRLAWTSPLQLVLWEPAKLPTRSSASLLSEGRVEVFWRAPRASTRADALTVAPPAAPADDGAPLEPEDIHDEDASRWVGRGFSLARGVDPATGLASDRLRVVEADGSRHELALPGEACGPTGEFGRPHYRISADGRHALDLRYVGGGCRAIWIDLASGSWAALDAPGAAPASCRSERRIPPDHLGVALRGYLREVEASLEAAGLDPARAFSLRIGPGGAAQAETRVEGGASRSVAVPPFPIATPLTLVHVANVATLDAPRTRPAAPPPRRVPVAAPGRSGSGASEPGASRFPSPEPL